MPISFTLNGYLQSGPGSRTRISNFRIDLESGYPNRLEGQGGSLPMLDLGSMMVLG